MLFKCFIFNISGLHSIFKMDRFCFLEQGPKPQQAAEKQEVKELSNQKTPEQLETDLKKAMEGKANLERNLKEEDSKTVGNILEVTADEQILRFFAASNDVDQRAKVASNPNAPENILRELAKDKDVSVRDRLANNQNTPGDILQVLAEDKIVEIRRRVASNESTPPNVLRMLAQDRDNDIENEDYEESDEIIDRSVVANVADNPGTPKDVLKDLYEKGYEALYFPPKKSKEIKK